MDVQQIHRREGKEVAVVDRSHIEVAIRRIARRHDGDGGRGGVVLRLPAFRLQGHRAATGRGADARRAAIGVARADGEESIRAEVVRVRDDRGAAHTVRLAETVRMAMA